LSLLASSKILYCFSLKKNIPLFGFFMQRVFSAELAIFFLLDFLLVHFFITGRGVVAALAFCALKCDYISHPFLASKGIGFF